MSDNGTIWGVPTKYTTDSDVGTVAYVLLGSLKECAFANAEADRQSKVYIKTQSLGRLSNFESATVCRTASRAWASSWNGVRITHLRFFDESSPTNVKEAVYNASTGQMELDGVSVGGGNGGGGASADLVVETPSVSNSSPDAGASLTLSATVRNTGNGSSAASTLRYYRSSDATISTSDTEVGTDAVGGLTASGASAESIGLTAPSATGTYYYGACVDAVSGESDTGNNCSAAVTVTVGAAPAPDLVVLSPSVNNNSPAAGASLTLSATVRNTGNGSSAASTLRYYRSSDATISAGDTEVGTDACAVEGLAASGASTESIGLSAPSNSGTYYYGACVDAVAGESDTGNNCSAAVSITVATVVPPTAEAAKLYWTDWGTDKIQRGDLDGSNVEDLVSGAGLDGPDGLALDMAGGKMYWTDAGTAKIQRADLDGSNVEDLITSGLSVPYGLALDVSGDKVYWTNRQNGKIQRADLDGSNVEDLLTLVGLAFPGEIALDVGSGKMYWTNPGADKIQRADLDGSNVEDLVTSGLSSPTGLALDVSGGKMYWTDRGTSKIQRADLDGSNVEDLVTSGLTSPNGLDLDVSGGKMYWTDRGTSKIQRADLDGSNVEDLVTSGLTSPNGLDLDVSGGKMYWTDVDADKVQRADLDGSNVEDLLTSADGLVDPSGLAVGAASGSSGGGRTYGVGDALPNFPSGFFIPARLSGASLTSSGGRTVLSFQNGGLIELQDGTRYTCIAAGGCSIESGRVTSVESYK